MKISALNNNSTPKFGGINVQRALTKAADINSLQQRLALGVTAIAFQPAIDMANKDVDKETGRISANRSFAKGLIGMTTGIITRGASMKAVEGILKNDTFADKLAKITAENKSEAAINHAKDFIKNKGGAKQYAGVIGTIAALGIMLITNFAVDAPLTNLLTNKMNEKYKKNEKGATPSVTGGVQ